MLNNNDSQRGVSQYGRSDTVADESSGFDSRWLNHVSNDANNVKPNRLLPMRHAHDNDSESRMSSTSAMSGTVRHFDASTAEKIRRMMLQNEISNGGGADISSDSARWANK